MGSGESTCARWMPGHTIRPSGADRIARDGYPSLGRHTLFFMHFSVASLQHLLDTWGYVAVLLFVGIESMGIPFPGETMLITAAAYAGAGHLQIPLVIGAATRAPLWAITWVTSLDEPAVAVLSNATANMCASTRAS